MDKVIVLKQEPVISYDKIEAIGKEVKAKIEALNLDNQVATPDTVKSLKTMRSDLRKDCKSFEDQRKAVKSAVMNPYSSFEGEYKAHILDQYKAADITLQSKILRVEADLKEAKKQKIESFFNDLCQSKGVDFVSFEKVGLNITLSASDKSLKDSCISFIDGVVTDLDLIDTQLYKAEITAEYKQSLNVSQAIKTVQDRKERERIELEKAEKEKQVAEEQKPIKKPVLSAPVEKEPEGLYTSTFTIKGTEAEIRSLRAYIENNTTLEIIKK